jgi:integrase
MAIKKVKFEADEEKIFDDAVIYRRGDYWQFRIWLTKEHKYARFSLKTKNKSTAIDKAKLCYHELMAQQLQGKRYFSQTTKMGVDAYLAQRWKDVEAGLIVKGRYGTIKTHLEHWLDFIGRDTKLKELERTDCENYFLERTKTKKKISVGQSTVANEQSSINALMSWLFKNKEAYIDSFDFKKLKAIDKGDAANRRAIFTDNEIERIQKALNEYINEAEKNINEGENLVKAITAYYLGCSIITGLRRGEQLQLCWKDISDDELRLKKAGKENIITITIRGETSKVRKTRRFAVRDPGYFDGLIRIKSDAKYLSDPKKQAIDNQLIFSVNGKNPITARAIAYHFDRILKLAKITDLATRDLVPYSFRHYFITKRVNSNLPIAAIAEMCGTSITQIEKTYYHTTYEKMISNALADYEYVEGILTPK